MFVVKLGPSRGGILPQGKLVPAKMACPGHGPASGGVQDGVCCGGEEMIEGQLQLGVKLPCPGGGEACQKEDEEAKVTGGGWRSDGTTEVNQSMDPLEPL